MTKENTGQNEMAYKVELPNGESVLVSSSQNIRKALADKKSQVYNSYMKYFNCRGLGTCGTCAVHVEGELSPPTRIEKWRLNFPPHQDSLSKGIRLMCQACPRSNLKLSKSKGLWGQ